MGTLRSKAKVEWALDRSVPMYANPDESAEIIAKAYNLTPDVAKSAVKNLLGSHDKSGVKYWSGGEINLKAMTPVPAGNKGRSIKSSAAPDLVPDLGRPHRTCVSAA